MKNLEEETSLIHRVEECNTDLNSLEPFACGSVKGKENAEMTGLIGSGGRQDTFDQIQLLLEDLRKVNVRIEDQLLTASDDPFSRQTNEIKHTLEEIRAEYSNILSNVEKGHKAVKSLKESQEFMESNDKMKNALEDSTYDSNIRNLNLDKTNSVLKINQPNTTLVYQLKTETDGPVKGNSRIKVRKTRSELAEETTMTRRTNSQYKTENINKGIKGYISSEEQVTTFDHFPSDSGSIVNLEAENKNLKKQIITLQEDLLSIKSELSPPLEQTDGVATKKEWKEGKPYSKNKAKQNRIKNTKHDPKYKRNSHSPMADITSNLRKGSIMSLVTNDDPQVSKMNLVVQRYSAIDSMNKKMDLKEKEIKSLKDALKAAEKSNHKEADRLRSAKLSDLGISEKLLHKSHECDELLEENIKLRKTIDEMGIEIRELELANLLLKNAKESLEITKEKNAEENSELMNRLQILQDEIEKCREVSNIKDQLSDKLAKVMIELNECKSINKEHKNRLNSLMKEKESKVSNLEKEIECLNRENQDSYMKRQELEEKSKCLEMKNDELCKSYEKRLSDQCDRLRMAETRAIKLEEKIPTIEVQKELEDLKRTNQILNEDVKRLNEQITTLQYEKVELSQQNERCEKVLSTIANENDTLKNERMVNESACRDLENELALLKSEKIRLEHILNCTNERSMEINENKNQLINRLSELEQQKANLIHDLELANQELLRLREENYQLDLKCQQILLESREKCSTNDDDSIDVEQQTDDNSGLPASTTSKPGTAPTSTPVCQNIRAYDFSNTSGIRRNKFHAQTQNKSAVDTLSQAFTVSIPATEGDGRPKGECKKRLPQRKKC